MFTGDDETSVGNIIIRAVRVSTCYTVVKCHIYTQFEKITK